MHDLMGLHEKVPLTSLLVTPSPTRNISPTPEKRIRHVPLKLIMIDWLNTKCLFDETSHIIQT